MANDATSYKLAYNNAEADYHAAGKELEDAIKAYQKNSTPENNIRLEKASKGYDAANQRYVDASREYRVYTDRKMLPESMGADKIKEAIMQDPYIKKQDAYVNKHNTALNQAYDEMERESGDPTMTRDGLLTIKSVDTVTSDMNKSENSTNKSENSSFLSGLTASISSAVSNTIDTVKNTADKMSGVLSDTKDKIAGMFSGNSKKKEETAALASPKKQGKKETATKVEEVSSDQHSAMQKPVAVVSKPVTEVTTNTKSAPVDQKKEELPKDGPLSKVGDKIKETTGKVASMTDAVKSVTNEISSNVKKATSVVNGVKSKITETVNGVKSVVSETVGTVKNTVKGAIDTVKTAANEVVGTATGIVSSVTQGITSFTNPIVGTITDTISAGKALTDELANSLPGPLGKLVNNKSSQYFASLTSKVANNKLMKVNTILTNINGLASTDKLTDAVGTALLAQLGSKYAKITDANGLSLSHLFGDNSKDIIDKYYEQLVKFCPDIEIKSNGAVNFDLNKSLFDSLLALLASSGASALLGQLLSCTASTNLYYDSSSIEVLKAAAEDARKRGDVDTYYTILGKIGKENLPNTKQDIVVLNANTTTEKAKENGTLLVYQDMCSHTGITMSDLLKTDTDSSILGLPKYREMAGTSSTFSGSSTQLFCANNTYIADAAIGSDTRKLIQASIYMNR